MRGSAALFALSLTGISLTSRDSVTTAILHDLPFAFLCVRNEHRSQGRLEFFLAPGECRNL